MISFSRMHISARRPSIVRLHRQRSPSMPRETSIYAPRCSHDYSPCFQCVSFRCDSDRIRSVPSGFGRRKRTESDHWKRPFPTVGNHRKCVKHIGFRHSDPIGLRSSEFTGRSRIRQNPIRVFSPG